MLPAVLCSDANLATKREGIVSGNHKIAIIGGGSAYVPGILHAIIRAEEALGGSEIALMDIAAPNMAVIAGLGNRMIAEAGANLDLTSSTDLGEASTGPTSCSPTSEPGASRRLARTI